MSEDPARRSTGSNPKYKIEACSLAKCPEVAISREQGNASVDTRLGNQRVSETRLTLPC